MNSYKCRSNDIYSLSRESMTQASAETKPRTKANSGADTATCTAPEAESISKTVTNADTNTITNPGATTKERLNEG